MAEQEHVQMRKAERAGKSKTWLTLSKIGGKTQHGHDTMVTGAAKTNHLTSRDAAAGRGTGPTTESHLVRTGNYRPSDEGKQTKKR